MSLTADHALAEIDGALVVLHLESGDFCVLEHFNLAHWQIVAAGSTLGAVLERLQKDCSVDDAAALVDQLVDLGFIEIG